MASRISRSVEEEDRERAPAADWPLGTDHTQVDNHQVTSYSHRGHTAARRVLFRVTHGECLPGVSAAGCGFSCRGHWCSSCHSFICSLTSFSRQLRDQNTSLMSPSTFHVSRISPLTYTSSGILSIKLFDLSDIMSQVGFAQPNGGEWIHVCSALFFYYQQHY